MDAQIKISWRKLWSTRLSAKCEYRVITGWVLGKCLFKDFAAKVDNDYIKEQKWHFKGRKTDEEDKYGGVFKFFIGPDQRRFLRGYW